MSFRWRFSPDQAFGGMATEYAAVIREGIRQLANRYAPEIEAYMKSTASWTDRTANARQTLHTEVEDLSLDMVRIVLSHGVEYGVYLEGFTPEGRETQQGGRFAIIAPTLDVFGPRIWNDVVAMLT